MRHRLCVFLDLGSVLINPHRAQLPTGIWRISLPGCEASLPGEVGAPLLEVPRNHSSLGTPQAALLRAGLCPGLCSWWAPLLAPEAVPCPALTGLLAAAKATISPSPPVHPELTQDQCMSGA